MSSQDTGESAAAAGAGAAVGVGQVIRSVGTGVSKTSGRAWVEIDGQYVALSTDGLAKARRIWADQERKVDGG